MMYINGTASISPQNSLDYDEFIKGLIEYEEEFLQSVKPDYNQFIKPIEARRMSKTVKNGIICSEIAMKEANIGMPDAIIVGTGLGIVSDTERFLESMLENKEKFLTPTSFIQSTHNTVAAQIALKLKCHNYNFTYVNRGFSFETALHDGIMHLKEGKKNILIGGADEMSDHYFQISKKTAWWKTESVKNTDLQDSKTKGALCGEGVTFFVLSDEKTDNSYAALKGLKMLYKPKDESVIAKELSDFLAEHQLLPGEIDLVIMGNSGDCENDKIYDNVRNQLFSKTPTAFFKHLIGEYHTASSFAMWLGANIIKSEKYPNFIQLNQNIPEKFNHVLIYNHYFNINHSFILLSKVHN